jgi:HK97 gp10 family phage protein
MTDQWQVTIEGLDDLDKQIEDLIKAMGPDEVEPILLTGAKKIKDYAKINAPLGPTGNLKKSIIAKTLQRRGSAMNALGIGAGNPAPAIAGIKSKIAPHAKFLEFGTVKMAAHPFLRPAWDYNKDRVQLQIIRELQGKLDEVVK